ncbi:MAG: hypothetical protein GY796_01195 [Chloroflexi bacterium]|nr:hypothetical protein [Chloroflexota bacterium]
MIESPRFSEEQIARMVRATLHKATQPDNGRLQQLMPAIPQKRRWLDWHFSWQRPLATMTVMLIVCLSGFGLYHVNRQPALTSPTVVAITATFTSEPTAAETEPANELTMTSTAVAHQTQPAIATPAPQPTPIAMNNGQLIISN